AGGALPVRRRGRGGYKGDDADSAAAEGFVGLVGGRFVVGVVGPVEQFALGLARNNDDDLAAHVDVAVVVPVPLGGRDAVAGEDQRRVPDRGLAVVADGAEGDVGPDSQRMADAVRT